MIKTLQTCYITSIALVVWLMLGLGPVKQPYKECRKKRAALFKPNYRSPDMTTTKPQKKTNVVTGKQGEPKRDYNLLSRKYTV